MDVIYGFVVLNYNNVQDTLECVESIFNIEGSNYEVVVVDNCSTDGSQKSLKEKLPSSVVLIKSPQNGGYSCGNNIGIKYFLERNIKNIFIATSDTIVKSKDILIQTERLRSEHVGIIGPDIITPQGIHQNPSKKKVSFLYIINIYFPRFTSFLRRCIYFLIPKILKFRYRTKQVERVSIHKSSEVYMVHGSFFLITDRYIEKIGILDESLFMYHEEDLIAFNCVSIGLKIIYSPSITVLHKCGATTAKAWGADREVTRNRTVVASKKELRKKITFTDLAREYIKRI